MNRVVFPDAATIPAELDVDSNAPVVIDIVVPCGLALGESTTVIDVLYAW